MNLIAQISGFVVLIAQFSKGDPFARLACRPQFLVMAGIVFADHAVRCVQNIFGGAVILLQLDHAGVFVVVLKIQYVLNGCAAEFVDTLIVITHNHNVVKSAGEQLCQLKLCLVCVLELIHANIAELALHVVQRLRILSQQPHRLHDNVIKIHQIGGVQAILIQRIDFRHLLQLKIRTCYCRKILWRKKTVLGTADKIHHAFDRQLPIIHIQLFHTGGNQLFGIIRVADAEALHIAKFLAPSSEKTKADGMERTRPDITRLRAAFTKGRGKAVLDLIGCFVCKGNRQN